MESVKNIQYFVTKMFEYPIVKGVGSVLYILSTFFFDKLHTQALLALFCLIIGDLVFGLIAAYQAGIPIESKKARKTAFKLVVYFALVSFAYLTEKAGFSYLPIDETMIGILAITELISILENTALMGYAVPQRLLNQMKSIRDDKTLTDDKK